MRLQQRRTWFLIFVLAALFCLQVEAAEAGLLSLLKQQLAEQFDLSTILFLGFALLAAFLAYVAWIDKSLNLRENADSEP